jgi:hypothetical protein
MPCLLPYLGFNSLGAGVGLPGLHGLEFEFGSGFGVDTTARFYSKSMMHDLRVSGGRLSPLRLTMT